MYVYFLIKEFNGNWWSLAYIPSALHDKYLPVVNVSIQGMNSINITIIVIQNLYLQLSNKFRLKLIVKVYILARNTQYKGGITNLKSVVFEVQKLNFTAVVVCWMEERTALCDVIPRALVLFMECFQLVFSSEKSVISFQNSKWQKIKQIGVNIYKKYH